MSIILCDICKFRKFTAVNNMHNATFTEYCAMHNVSITNAIDTTTCKYYAHFAGDNNVAMISVNKQQLIKLICGIKPNITDTMQFSEYMLLTIFDANKLLELSIEALQ